MPKAEQWVRDEVRPPTPGFPNGKPTRKVWVDLSDADFVWYREQLDRLLKTESGSEERAVLIQEVYAVVELNFFCGAYGLSDEEVEQRGLDIPETASPDLPAGAAQEAPGAAPGPPAIDTSQPWGAAAARLWEAQAERYGIPPGSSAAPDQEPPEQHEQVSLFTDADREENLVRLDEAKRAVMANTPGKYHAEPHPTERGAALKAAGRTGSQRRLVFDAIGRAPDGLTDEEIAVAEGVADTAHRTRRNELVTAGLVEDSGRTRKTASGTDSIVWTLTPLGRQVLAA